MKTSKNSKQKTEKQASKENRKSRKGSRKRSNKKKSNRMIQACIYGLAVFFLAVIVQRNFFPSVSKVSLSSYSNVKEASIHDSSSRGEKERHEQRVNHYLREMDEKILWESAKMEVENHRYAPQVEKKNHVSDIEQLVVKQMNFGILEQKDDEVFDDPLSQVQYSPVLDDKIDAKLWGDQVSEEDFKRSQEEYVKQFVENAKRAGYRVILDKNLRVQRVYKAPVY